MTSKNNDKTGVYKNMEVMFCVLILMSIFRVYNTYKYLVTINVNVDGYIYSKSFLLD